MLSEFGLKRIDIRWLLSFFLMGGLIFSPASIELLAQDDPFSDSELAAAEDFGDEDDPFTGGDDFGGDDFGDEEEFDPFGDVDQPSTKPRVSKAKKQKTARHNPKTVLASRLKKLGYHGIGDETESEVRIMEALEENTSLEFQEGDPLSQVAAVIGEGHGIPIHFDMSSLEDESIDPVSDGVNSFRAAKIKLKNALTLIFEPLGLTYVIRNEVLMITSKTTAEQTLTTKMYRISDRWEVDEKDFADTIRQMVQPNSWDEVGGPGAIKVVSGGLFVSNAAAVHRDIEKLCVKFDVLYP